MKLMKFFYTFIFIIISLSCQSCDFNQSPGDKLINQLILKVTKKISKKYPFEISAVGGSEDEKKVLKISVHYDYYGDALDLNKSKILMVNIIENYLNEINNDEKIRPFLKNHPFTILNLHLVIITNQLDGEWYFDPNIDTVNIINDTIKYSTRDPNNHFKYKNTTVEKYEDALKIVKDNGQLSLFD